MIRLKPTTVVWSLVCARTRPALPLLLLFMLANSIACNRLNVSKASGDTVFLNRDLSNGDLTQWTHRDFGSGTDAGSNTSGAGYLWYHANVGGRRAASITVTPTAHASPAANSDSVYLWEPRQFWNHQPYEIWLRTSVLFPSATTISSSGLSGEAPFAPTTGEWNWFLEFHNDSSPLPSCAKEFANISLDVKTDGPVLDGVVGTKNPRMALRIMGGSDCSPSIVWVDGPPLQWDHWYEILLHIKWDPKRGIVEWYLDNLSSPYYSNLKIPTLFTRPKGYVSPSYTSLTVPNYRLHATWNSTIYLGPLAVGSTKNSVLNALNATASASRMLRSRPPEPPVGHSRRHCRADAQSDCLGQGRSAGSGCEVAGEEIEDIAEAHGAAGVSADGCV